MKKAPVRANRALGEEEPHFWTYSDLQQLTGKELKAIYQHRTRGSFDPDDFGSVVRWVARHAIEPFRTQIQSALFQLPEPSK